MKVGKVLAVLLVLGAAGGGAALGVAGGFGRLGRGRLRAGG